MLKERFQVLLSSAQRRRLEREADRRGTSVAALIREAIDSSFPGPAREERHGAVDAIRALQGRFVPPGELDVLAEDEGAEDFGRLE